MNREEEIKIVMGMLEVFNDAKFNDIPTAKMINHTRKLEAVARMIAEWKKPIEIKETKNKVIKGK